MKHPLLLPTLALTLISAWAQAPFSPEQLLGKFIETGDRTLLERVSAHLDNAPAPEQNTNRMRLLRARLEYALGHYEKSLELARIVNRDVPDELDPYGVIVDSARALGRTDEAERAAQWMVNLRPEDTRGLQRAAALREDFGDFTGSGELLRECYRRLPRTDLAGRASVLIQQARMDMKRDRFDEARKLAGEALRLIAGYYPAVTLLRELEEK